MFWGKELRDRGPDIFYEMCVQRCVEKEIMCMTTNSVGVDDTRLLVGTQDSVVQVWKVGSAVECVFFFEVAKDDTKCSCVCQK